MIMRLLDRDLRADSSTGAALPPTRITHASNFSLASRSDFSADMGMVSMPNWRKHSVSRLRDDSGKSTSAARAENFFEGDRDIREFPKSFSVGRMPSPPVPAWNPETELRCYSGDIRRNPILARET